MSKPLAIDLFCGLGGWADGFLAEGYDVIGFDIERHRYPKVVSRESQAVKRPGMNWSDQTKRGADAAMFNHPPKLDPDGGWDEYPAQLVLQDVMTLHGSQFRHAAVIVASPPCQEYSRYAMPFGGLWLEHNRMDDDGGPPGQTQTNSNPVHEATKQRGTGPEWFDHGIAAHGSRSNARKASAQIAKIPFLLAWHIARVFKP